MKRDTLIVCREDKWRAASPRPQGYLSHGRHLDV